MTREEVKKQLLNEIDKSAKKHGGLDEIMCRSPQIGKSKGQKVMAYSKKDAIKRLNHKKSYDNKS